MTEVDELGPLLALQDLDSRIDQERHRLAHLPGRGELADLGRALAQAQQAWAVVNADLEEAASRQAAAEQELKATEDRISLVNARLYGGSVTASRELQAMAADVEGLRKRASELEDRVLVTMEEREPLASAEEAARKVVADLQARRAEVGEQLAGAEVAVTAVLTELGALRPGAVAQVGAGLLATYERLRARLGGVAVSRLVGGRCDGCHLSLPAVELDRMRHQPPGSLEYCDQCGRILVINEG